MFELCIFIYDSFLQVPLFISFLPLITSHDSHGFSCTFPFFPFFKQDLMFFLLCGWWWQWVEYIEHTSYRTQGTQSVLDGSFPIWLVDGGAASHLYRLPITVWKPTTHICLNTSATFISAFFCSSLSCFEGIKGESFWTCQTILEFVYFSKNFMRTFFYFFVGLVLSSPFCLCWYCKDMFHFCILYRWAIFIHGFQTS